MKTSALKIGYRLCDGSVIIYDEDCLCYQVQSKVNGVSGMRTINKSLLE